MKKTITYKQLQVLDSAATAYLIRTDYFVPMIPACGDTPAVPGRFTDKEDTKLSKNIKNIIKQGNKLFEEYNELKADILLDNCLVDEKTKAILYDDSKDANGNVVRNYRFSKEGHRAANKAVKDLANKEIEIHVRITDGDWDLTDEEKEAFNGILIPEFKMEEVEN